MTDETMNGTVEGMVVEASAIDEPAAPSTQLVRRERRSEVLHPLDRHQLVASFREYQELCKELLDDSDYQAYTQRERDTHGNWQTVEKRFKKKSAWRKLATAFDLDVQIVHSEVQRDPHGEALRASVIARAITPSGRYQDGDGHCSATEPRFLKDRGREKLENDLRGTATTRAKNRAIADLLGTGEVSAEEVGSGGSTEPAPDGPAYGPLVSAELKQTATHAAIGLCGGELAQAKALWETIQQELDGYMPEAAARALVHAAAAAAPTPAGAERQGEGTHAPGSAAAQPGSGDTVAEPSAGAEPTSSAATGSNRDGEPAAGAEPAPTPNPDGARLRAIASARGIGDPDLANLIRNAVGQGPIPADRARTALAVMLERISEDASKRTTELIDMFYPPAEEDPRAVSGEVTSVDFAALEPPQAA